MSWLARSITNTVKLEESNEKEEKSNTQSDDEQQQPLNLSFLAPPQPSDSSPNEPEPSELSDLEEAKGISRIWSKFAKIGGRFRSGILKFSNIAAAEITKMAFNFLQLGLEDEEDYDLNGGGDATGVTDVTMHPET